MAGVQVGSRLAAETVEKDEKEDGDNGIEEGGAEKMEGEPGFRLREQNAAREGDDGLMEDEEARGDCETRGGMFSVETRADR